jgi:TetR/AcrR family transcriptional regulator, tetracycline repressor protein
LAGHGFTPVLALRTITAIASYVTGFVLREQTKRPPSPEAPADASVTALAQLLDDGMSAPLLVAIQEGGSPLGEESFEHGLRLLIDGTTIALQRENYNT